MRTLLIVLLLTSQFSHTETLKNEHLSKVQQLELAFFYAIRHGKIDIVEEFINAGVDVNYQNNVGYSPLMVASFRGQTDMVNFLLSKGANTCLVDKRGNTALMAAIVSAEFRISQTLLSHHCDDNKIQQRTRQFAEQFGQDNVLKLLNFNKTQW